MITIGYIGCVSWRRLVFANSYHQRTMARIPRLCKNNVVCVYINTLYVLGSTCIAFWLLLGMSSSHIRLIYGKLSPSCYLFNARRTWRPCVGLNNIGIQSMAYVILRKSHTNHQSQVLIGLWSLMYIQNNLLQRESAVRWYMTTMERRILVFFPVPVKYTCIPIFWYVISHICVVKLEECNEFIFVSIRLFEWFQTILYDVLSLKMDVSDLYVFIWQSLVDHVENDLIHMLIFDAGS